MKKKHQHQYAEEKIQKVPALETEEGKGARVKRLFPSSYMASFDPFALMDEFFVEQPAGFPLHHHRGFEAITYMIQGGFSHVDNLGNKESIFEGDVQRFTAGRGIEHSEHPVESGVNQGIQLWINLPPHLKKTDPSYQRLENKDLPTEETTDVYIKHIAGNNSPLWVNTSMEFADITLAREKSFTWKVPLNYNGLIYVVSGINGKLITENEDIKPGEALFFENIPEIKVKSKEEACRFVIITGLPHNQPINIRGTDVE